MKIRSDFVTNSSSSSFIVGFKDENNIERILSKEKHIAGYYDTILKDVKRRRITKAEALRDYLYCMDYTAKTKVENKYIKKIGWQKFREWKKDWEHNEEFEQAVNDELKAMSEKYKKKIDKCGYLAEVHYSDAINSELEHEIMPSLSCTIQRFSHH